jgi:hypothetical protein
VGLLGQDGPADVALLAGDLGTDIDQQGAGALPAGGDDHRARPGQ